MRRRPRGRRRGAPGRPDRGVRISSSPRRTCSSASWEPMSGTVPRALATVEIDRFALPGGDQGHDRALRRHGQSRTACETPRDIVGQEFEDEDPRVRRGRQARQVPFAPDPEMCHGRKTAAKPLTGYKLHAAAATEAPLLTSIYVSPGSEDDGQHAATLIDQEPEELRPERVIGDTVYGNIETRERSRTARSKCSPPSTRPRPRTGHSEGRLCDGRRGGDGPLPAGRDTRMHKPDPRGERVARFQRKACEPCPIRERCAPAGSGRSASATARSSPRRPEGATRSRRARAPLPRPAPNRTTARAYRPSLPRAQGSLPPGSKSDAAGRVNRGVGQSAPDRGGVARRGGLRGAVSGQRRRQGHHVGRPRPGGECATQLRLPHRSRSSSRRYGSGRTSHSARPSTQPHGGRRVLTYPMQSVSSLGARPRQLQEEGRFCSRTTRRARRGSPR